ncbi:MAG: hypothetical protein KatS3mg015_2859 [Fimbriimonadales bacterium]|nr:MAG: hypothetical protein KatS3mg015_2859 [Fimbriimonadales bacterium]
MRVLILMPLLAALVLMSGTQGEASKPSVHVRGDGEQPVASAAIAVRHGPEPPEPDFSQVPDLSIDPRFRIAVAATMRVNAMGGQLDEREMRAILELSGWQEELIPEAMLVAWCESKWSPWAVGDGGNSLGLFQLWNGWFAAFGFPAEMWNNPVANATAARLVLERRGRWGGGGGWSCAP